MALRFGFAPRDHGYCPGEIISRRLSVARYHHRRANLPGCAWHLMLALRYLDDANRDCSS
jgi:hypothetical protein